MQQAKIGIIGLGVMGGNLARNLANHKISTIVFNRTSETTRIFLENFANSFLQGETNLKKFIQKIARPRSIIIMVKAGPAIDEMLSKLIPLLDRGDIVIDCGNSHFADTERRYRQLAEKKLNFFGCGVSGGEVGALNGPSLMPGGNKEVWKKLQPILETIAAKDFHGKPCVAYLGDGGAGHYVKMVHNGIEYGVMQIMAEAYGLLRSIYHLPPPAISAIFKTCNEGKLNSFLFEIATKILGHHDEFKKGYTIDFILDQAGQKGTGTWTSEESLKLGCAIPTITEAVMARLLSGEIKKRTQLQKFYGRNKAHPSLLLKTFIPKLEKALQASIISTYAQGFDLLQKASQHYHWPLEQSEIARIWQGGCIIRAKILKDIEKASSKQQQKHLFELALIRKELKTAIPELKNIVALGVIQSIPLACLSSALVYFETLTQAKGSANFIQGLRDYFGAHGYERTDRPGTFHTNWE